MKTAFCKVRLFLLKCAVKHVTIKSSFSTALGKSWDFKVEPFWKFSAQLACNSLYIEPHDINAFPDGDLLTIEIFSKKEKADSYHNYKVCLSEHKRSVSLQNFNSERDDFVVVKVPPIFDVDARLSGKSFAQVSNIECTSTTVNVEDGDILLHNVKGKSISLQTKHGDIKATKLLQGNLCLKTDKGKISADKLQGPGILIESGDGAISLKDVYAEVFEATAKNGNLKIKSLHGNANIDALRGDVLVGTVEGKLNASAGTGNINVHFATSSDSKLTASEGDIFISIAPGLAARYHVKAKTASELSTNTLVDYKEESSDDHCTNITGSTNGSGPLLQATATNGAVKLQSLNWMERIAEYTKLKTL